MWIWLMLGCVRGPVERFTVNQVVPAAMGVGDVDRACRTGGALGHALMALPKRAPHRAMVIADATAALCAEADLREAEVDMWVLPGAVPPGEGRVVLTLDARERRDRARRLAALRFLSAWEHTTAVWEGLGETCPRIRSRDEATLLVGLMAGTLAMLDDKATGGHLNVPLDTLARVGRAARCLDDDTWFAVPSSFEAAAWTVVPGSAPAEVDPWDALQTAAERGALSGVRLGYALQALIASNAGRSEVVEGAISAAARSFETVPTHSEYALFDAYAHDLLQHEADLIWARARGHRAPNLSLPPEPVEVPQSAPEGADPFASDPFAEEP